MEFIAIHGGFISKTIRSFEQPRLRLRVRVENQKVTVCLVKSVGFPLPGRDGQVDAYRNPTIEIGYKLKSSAGRTIGNS